MARDYYEILGVGRTADDDEIRAAYRKLVRQLHPDVNKSPDAAKKFGEVQHAYEVVSDPQKRKLYDQFGEAGLNAGTAGTAPGATQWGGAAKGRGKASGINIDGFDFDPDDLSSVFESIFGGDPAGQGGHAHSAGARRPGRSRGPIDVRDDLDVDFMTAAKGGKRTLRLSVSGRTREIEVKVPAGVEEGAVLRMQGPFGPAGEPAHLLLTVHVGRHPLYVRGSPDAPGKGLDLTLEVPVNIAEAGLGATVSIPTLTGKAEIKIPAESASGRRLRLKGQGIRDAEGRVGDLYAVVRIVPPPTGALTDQEREALRVLGEKTPALRTGSDWSSDT